jgi:microcystin-dependent protein
MSSPFLSEIRCFGFNFAPKSWALCNGQIMAISQNAALYSLLGTNFGGNGTQTFGLPNLQGQIPMHWGSGPDGFITSIGEVQGTTAVSLQPNEIPLHTHQANAVIGASTERVATPDTNGTSILSESAIPNQAYVATPTINAPFSTKSLSPTGSSVAHDNMQPYQVINFCIALMGIFPARN